jgi:lysophospholipase L1-like esterase/acetyl esterase/lipase
MKLHLACLSLVAGMASLFSAAADADPARAKAEWISLEGQPVASGNPVGADGLIRQYKGPAIRLMRSAVAEPKGTILLFPGGGYGILSAIAEGSKTAEFLNQCGFDVAILEYRIASGDKTRDLALDDAVKSWRLIKADTQALGLHGGRFGMMGYSAGGHLAARTTQTLAANPQDTQPDELILTYPAYLDECPKGSVWPAVLPPATPKGRLFLLIAANDNQAWVKSDTIYAKAWKGYDGQATFHLIPDGGHGFGMGGNRAGAAQNWPDLLKAFLEAKPEAKPAQNPAAIAKGGNGGRHQQKVAAIAKEKFDLLLVGDSITHNFDNSSFQPVWQQFFGPRKALNLGYSGYRTENILWNLQNGELEGQSPKVITLMIGTNNVDEKNYPTRHTAGQVAGGTKAILDLLRQKCPDAKILLLRPFPGSYDGQNPTSHRMILERTGDLIKAFADDQHIFYCDVNPVFLNPDGSINKKLMPDCLHPSPEGARLWAEAMEPLLCKLMGDQNRSNSAVASMTKLENDGYDWMDRHNEILQIKEALNPDLVFIGDSITHAWGGVPATGARKAGEKVLQTAFAGHRVLNLGFGWDRTQNVLWRLDNGELDKLQPKFVVIHIGTNNTSGTGNARQNTPDEIAAGIRAICDRVQKQAPQAKIILMAVFPREQKPDHPRRLQINEINKRIAEFGKQPGITFVDIGPKFLNPDGTIPRELMSDFCHPTEKGYQIWADALAPILAGK